MMLRVADRGRPSVRSLRSLSPRETQLILLAGDGLTDKEIASVLKISPGTIVNLWSRLRAKLGICSRSAAVSMMSAVVSRVNSVFGYDESHNQCTERMLGQLSGIRILVNRKHIILSASPKAEMLFGLRQGHSLVPCELASEGSTWAPPLGGETGLTVEQIEVRRGSEVKRFQVRSNVFDDPILHRVAIVEFASEPRIQAAC